jgi:hypothetical protein
VYVMYVQRSMAGLSQAAGKWLIKNGLVENLLCKSACQGDLLRRMLIPIWAQFHYAYGDSPYANFSGSPHVLWELQVCVRGSVSELSAIFPRVTRWIRIFTCVARWIRILRMHNMHTPRPKQIAWHEIPIHTGIKINPPMHTGIIRGSHDT